MLATSETKFTFLYFLLTLHFNICFVHIRELFLRAKVLKKFTQLNILKIIICYYRKSNTSAMVCFSPAETKITSKKKVKIEKL